MEISLDDIKKRLLLPLPGKDAQWVMAPSFRPDTDSQRNTLLAGVTILLYPKNNTLFFPLIERPQYNGVHSGQISLPGGKMEEGDRNLIITALRECEEEIGADASRMIVMGSLTSIFIPVSNYEVHPVVCFFPHEPDFTPQATEVVDIIEVPVDLILSETTVEEKKVMYNGREETVPYFNVYGKVVWGATAMILNEFKTILKESTGNYSTRFL